LGREGRLLLRAEGLGNLMSRWDELCHGSIVSRTPSTGKERVRRVAADAARSGGIFRDLAVKAVPERFLRMGWLNKYIFFQTVLRTNLGIVVAKQTCGLKFFLWLPMRLRDAGKWRVSG